MAAKKPAEVAVDAPFHPKIKLSFDLDAVVNADTARAVSSVILERKRQITAKGYTRDHDDEMGPEHLRLLAKKYIDSAQGDSPYQREVRRKRLLKAAVLLIAAIEVIDRATPEVTDNA